MEAERSKDLNEMKEVVEQLQNTLNKYNEEYMFSTDEVICKKVYIHLSSACANNGKLICRSITEGRVFDNLALRAEKICIIEEIREAVKIVLENYNEELASTVEKVIRSIKNSSKQILAQEILAEMKELEQSLKLGKYLKNHVEFDKIKKLIELEEQIEQINERKPVYIHEFIGAKMILDSFKEELKVIPEIIDKNFRCAVLEYFEENLPLETLFK